jgi:hypothetical protein
MKWCELRDFINSQVHENAEVDFIIIGPKTKQIKIVVRNYGESFRVEEVATNANCSSSKEVAKK